MYLIVAIAAQAVHGPGFLTANSDDVLSATGNLVLASPFDKLLILAVLSSAAASTQTTILPAARSELSMAAHRAAPRWFAHIDPKIPHAGQRHVVLRDPLDRLVRRAAGPQRRRAARGGSDRSRR